MNTPRPILERLAEADRRHQHEVGGRRALRGLTGLWLGLLLLGAADVFLHLGAGVRLAGMALLILAALGLFGWSAWLAYYRKNSVEAIARRLEERDPTLGSKLINLLQLRAQTTDPKLPPRTRELAQQAIAGYDQRLATVPLEELARTDLLRRETWRAGWIVLAFVAVLALFHPITRVELARLADPFGDHPPYSFTQLAIIEPGPDGTNIVYGREFLVQARSSGHRPKDLYLTYHPPGMPERAVTVPMLDKGSVGFHQRVDAVQTELEAYVHTKDRHSVSKRARLGVILVPQLERAWVEVTPPAYTGLKPEEKLYTFRSVEALVGSQIKFRLQSNRPLRGGSLLVFTEGATNSVALAVTRTNEVMGTLPATASGRLRFQVEDVDGIASQSAWEGPLIVQHDLPPEIRIVEPARDSFVSLDFKVNAQVEANDDYGLRTVRLHRALNGVYSAPKVVTYDTVIRSSREGLTFDFRGLGVRPGDVISFFAEVVDTSPAAQMARSQVVNLSVISVEDYNEFLRERSDLSALQGKYAELFDQLHELLEQQKDLAEAAAKAQQELAAAEKSGDAAAREELQRRLDSLLARQHELNARLNQQAERMETFVRDNPMYDLETEFGAALKELAKDIRQSTEATAQQTREVAQASSPPDGSRKVTPEMLQKLQSAAAEQAKRLGQVEEQAEEEVSEPLKDLTRLQELMKDFNQFETLFNTQQSLAEQARAYNRKGQLSREDQLALRDLASTQRQVGELLESLEKKLREDSAAAREEFPKAARSGEALADKIGERRLQQLAWNATRSLLAGQGEESFQSTDRLREEMAKLFGECQSEGGQPGRQELDQYLKLTRGGRPGKSGMQAGNSFSQMMKSRNFRKPGKKSGQGSGQSGQGESGESGYAIQSQQSLDVLGNESFVQRGQQGTQSARSGGAGSGAAAAEGVQLDKSDLLKNLKPVNRQSGAVQSESLIEEYSEVVERYFKALTK